MYGNPENTESYIDPENDFNQLALKKATKEVCAKLKRDWGENLRIYVVKYRKQDKYSVLVRNGTEAHKKLTKSHDYSAVNACASGENYVYEAADEEELKEKLAIIASDIKEFAGYEDAKSLEV